MSVYFLYFQKIKILNNIIHKLNFPLVLNTSGFVGIFLVNDKGNAVI
jgi:hypothetical protein